MQNHLDKKCLGVPDNAKSKKNINSQVSTTSTIHTPTITPNTTHINIPVKQIKITKTSKIENFIDCEEFHTGEWISNEIIQQMEAIGVQKFSAVITDIASIDEIKTIIENSKMIVNYFKSYVQAAAKLKCTQGENYNKGFTSTYIMGFIS
ncbi:unnamed protein product [Rhizophagus irregularis]|nr:unnamed protein product [Rhizophagus irregularis]